MHSRAVYWDSMDEALECQPAMWSVPDKTWLGNNLGDLWASCKALGEAVIGTKMMSWHTPVATNLQFGRESSLKQCSGPLWITCQSCWSAVFLVNILNWTLTTASPTRKRLPHFRQNDKGSSGFKKCQSTRTGSGEVSLDVRATQGAMWYAFRLQDEASSVTMIRTSSVRIMESWWELYVCWCSTRRSLPEMFHWDAVKSRSVHLVEWQTMLLGQHECDWIGLICQPVSPLTSNQLVQFR